jgi:sec-independent protein translocase protein TatB
MFDIGWSELVVIAVVALIAIGPKELPGVLRMAGQWIGKIRRMAADFQSQFQEALREAEMEDLKQQVDEIKESATRDLTAHFDPLKSVRDEIDSSLDSIRVDHPPASEPPTDLGHVPPSGYGEGTPEHAVETPAVAGPAQPAPAGGDEPKPAADRPEPTAAAGGHSA